MSLLRLILALCAALIITSTISATEAYAQSGAGIGLEPALIEESIDPGTEYRFSIEVSNLRNQEQIFYLFVRNISGVRNGNVPIFETDNTEKTGYELADWVELDETEITMQANESRSVSFTMRVPEDASPGSHFGGFFISAEPPRLRSSGAGVGYEVASILSMRVSGDVVESAMLRSFRTDNYIYSRPNVTFTANIRNDGNVLVRPIGPLEVFNMFGKRVALMTFNENEAGVFPKTDREFQITWEDDGTGFGRYQAILSPVFGQEGGYQTITSSVSFWILPMNIIGPAALILGTLLLVVYFGIKWYVRRQLSHVYGGRTMVRRRRGGKKSSPVLLILVVMLTVTALFLIVLLALFA